ncbi:uncharacterized protein [Choristoneura fumiferana]|uniref:uncharacterized protein n=1 Tax=Choristoneura fumiferana TaxID=7141 RepID=UPI003D15A862
MLAPSEEPNDRHPVPRITDDEMMALVDRLRSNKKAPGPDGVPARVIPLALEHLGERFRDLLSECLETERFPKVWKEGRLCLLRKEGRPVDSPSGHRPLVLLDVSGKMLERVIARRIIQHMEEDGPNVADCQYGFRAGRGTIDAIKSLKDFSDHAASRGEGVIAVSLDIANAFGTLPYEVIKEALRYHGLPLYLQRIVGHYLEERVVLYEHRGQLAHMAACVLAGTPPWDVDAQVMSETYWSRREARAQGGERLAPRELANARRMTEKRIRDRWKDSLEDCRYGTRTIVALLPSFDEWVEREIGAISYRMTQVMTGHGCFGHYLHRIGREISTTCHQCAHDDDTAQHTLEVCPAWEPERQALVSALGRNDLSLANVVSAMLEREESWEAFYNFCEAVISQKEEAEREREDEVDAPQFRRRRRGVRRRRFATRQIPQ